MAPERIAVIGAPSSAGAYAPGQERAPRALRDAGLLEALVNAGWEEVDDAGDVEGFRWAPDGDDPAAANVADAAAVAGRVAGEVRRVLDDGARRALVLGGDCTVGVGAVAGVAHRGRVGLVYLDLHADMNVPDATEDGTLDWMGVAHLLALDGTRSELRDVGLRTPLLQGKDLVLVGFDPDYATAFELAAIAEQDVTVVTVADLAADPKGAARRALAALADCDVLSVHLDVDLVDFLELPLSENTERDGGVTLQTALAALHVLAAHDRTATVTLTELNPDHGAADGSTLAPFVAGVAAALAPKNCR
ncbi:arginase family protein [Conexibacter woesei]|uniref:arginase family protein n=1 Tax=Conexibacter woesei TaxID=191495 RepID=UPI0004228544|nr:arginase family protein [Conexibacter woesei]